LPAFYRKVFCKLSKPVSDERQNLKKYIRKASVELWRAIVPHNAIQEPVENVIVTLRRVLAFENDNIFSPIITKMPLFVR
jgi:hypothetical protein